MEEPLLGIFLISSGIHSVSEQGLLTPENCPKGKDNDDVVIETYFVFAAIW